MDVQWSLFLIKKLWFNHFVWEKNSWPQKKTEFLYHSFTSFRKDSKDLQPEPFWRIKETMLALRATLLHYDSYVRTVEAIQTAESKVSMLTRAEWRRTPSNIWWDWFSVLNKASKCTVYLPSRKSSGVAGNWLLAFCVSSLIYTCLRKVTPHKCHAALTWRKRLDR